MTHARIVLRIALGLLCVRAPVSAAQTPEPCTYNTCALRLRHGLFSVQLVQGRDQRPVSSVGWFPPALPLFAERSDTAAQYYASFRRRHASGTVLSLAGAVALAAGLIAYDSDNDLGLGLFIGSALLGIGGAVQTVRAREQLSRAVWWYNRTLGTSP